MWMGAHWFVAGGIVIASTLGVSALIIGLTIGAVGTSLPELIVSWLAAGVGTPGISLGNVVGSNIANIGLALGVGAVIFPVPVEKSVKKYDYWVLLISVLGLLIITWDLIFTGIEGIVFVLLFILYLFFLSYRHKKLSGNLKKKEKLNHHSLGKGIVFFIAGVLGLYAGSRLTINAAYNIAVSYGVSDTIIGITAVAVGTSLPEVAVVVSGSLKKKPEISLGTIIGSNIINTFLVAGGAAIINPIVIVKEEFVFLVPSVLLFTLLLLPAIFLGKKINRLKGVFLLSGYIIYVAVLI